MALIRLTKEFDFEAAHALFNYDGKCKNMHGHSYRLFVTVKGEPLEDKSSPKLGMVMDFGNLKSIVKKMIVDKFDHAVIVNSEADYVDEISNKELFYRKIILPFQPTCENMVIYFAEKISEKLPKEVTLYSVKLYETSNSFAEWVADDN